MKPAARKTRIISIPPCYDRFYLQTLQEYINYFEISSSAQIKKKYIYGKKVPLEICILRKKYLRSAMHKLV